MKEGLRRETHYFSRRRKIDQLDDSISGSISVWKVRAPSREEAPPAFGRTGRVSGFLMQCIWEVWA